MLHLAAPRRREQRLVAEYRARCGRNGLQHDFIHQFPKGAAEMHGGVGAEQEGQRIAVRADADVRKRSASTSKRSHRGNATTPMSTEP